MCTPCTGTTTSLVTAACEDISVSVSVGSKNATDTIGITNHQLGINKYEQVTVTISYSTNADLADGPFDIKFGDITLNYGSVDGTGEVYTVTYDSSITNNGYPGRVANGSNLQVVFTEPIPAAVELYVDDVEVDSSLYIYENGTLTYSNVFGNISIKEIKEIKEINFTIGSSTYTALEGMTWAEWILSDYNIKTGIYDVWYTVPNTFYEVRCSDGSIGWYYLREPQGNSGSSAVLASDLIYASNAYTSYWND